MHACNNEFTKEKEIICKKYLRNIDFIDEKNNFHIGEQVYPEQEKDLGKRCKSIIEKLNERYQSLEKKRILHVIITHGCWIEEYSKYYGGNTTWENYCKVVLTEHQNDKINLLVDGQTYY